MPRSQKHYTSTKNTERRLKNILLTTILRNRKQSFKEKHKPDDSDNSSSIENNQRTDSVKWTDKAGVILSGLALIMAGFLYAESYFQRKLTEKSTNAAIKAVNHSIYQDSINYDRDTTNDRIQSKIDEFNMATSRQSLQQQISSIKETQKQFKLSTKPFLQFIAFHVYYNDREYKLEIEPVIENQGIHPAKILYYKNVSTYRPKNYKLSAIKANMPSKIEKIPVSRYVIKENPYRYSLITNEAINPNTYNKIKQGIYSVYLIGEVAFENAITKEKRKYFYCIQITQVDPGSLMWLPLENENL